MWRGCILWRHHVGGCTHPWRISIFPHGHACFRVSLHRVLILPWNVSVIPHRHIRSKVCLHRVFTVLFSLFHLVTIQIQSRFCGRSSLTSLPPRFLIHREWIPEAKTRQHKNSPATTFFFFFYSEMKIIRKTDNNIK